MSIKKNAKNEDDIMEQRKLLHNGYLRKSPPHEKIIKNYKWHKRYFKLWSDKTLEYYKNISKGKPLKEPIDLKSCTKVQDSFQEYEKYVSKNYKWPFCLNMPNRHYYFLARSEDDRNKWVNVLKKLCESVTQSNDEFPISTVLTEFHSSSVIQNSQFTDFTENYDELPQLRHSYINMDPISISPNCSYALLQTDDSNSIDVSNYDFLPPSVPANQQDTDDSHFNFDNYTPLPAPVPFVDSNPGDDNVLGNNEMSLMNYSSVPNSIPVGSIYKKGFTQNSGAFDDLVEFPAIDNHLNFLKSIKQHSTKHKHNEDLSENHSGSSGYVPMDHIPIENCNKIEPEEYIKVVEPTKLATINPGKEFRKFTTQSSTDSASSDKIDAGRGCLNNISSTLNSSHLDQIRILKSKHTEKIKPSENHFDPGLFTKSESANSLPPVILRETKPSPAIDRSIKPTSMTKHFHTDTSYDYVCPIGKHDRKLDTPKFKILNGQHSDHGQPLKKGFEKDQLSPRFCANNSFEHLNGTFPLNNNALNHKKQKYADNLPDFEAIQRDFCIESSNIFDSNHKAYHCITNKTDQTKTCYEKASPIESMVYENIKPESIVKNDSLTYITCSYNDTKSHSKVGVQLSRFTTIDTEKSEALKNLR